MNSLGTARHRNLADLPTDILREIFDYFPLENGYRGSGPRYCSDQPDPGSDDFKTIQTLRLVCRSFYEVASPLLMPILRVRISQESLDRVNQVTKNPLIAAGVRNIQISVAYRPKELAQDAEAYRVLHTKALERIEHACDWYTEFMDEIPNEELEGDEEEVRRVMGIYGNMTWAWRDWPVKQAQANWYRSSDTKTDDYYREILSKSFDQYRQLHQEQNQLLTDGSFVTTVATIASRLPSLRALSFVDEADVSPDQFNGREELTILANDHTKLRKLLIAPHSWAALEELDPIPEIQPVKLLWHIPLAMHSYGTIIPAISISRIPILSNFSYLCPPESNANDSDLLNLASAFTNLKSIDLSAGNCGVIRPQHMPPEDQAHLTNYISALLSGTVLKSIHVDLYGLGINTGRGGNKPKTPDMFNPLGSAFAKLQAPEIREFVVSQLCFTQAELERCFGGFGTKLNRLHVYNIGVSEGGKWVRALEILRGKMRGDGSVFVSSLCGGGFEKVRGIEVKEESVELWSPFSTSGRSESAEEEELLQAVRDYLLGKEEGNPMVALEG